MPSNYKLLLIVTFSFLLLSCSSKNNNILQVSVNDSLVVRVLFHPSFEENSEILLVKTDSIKTIQILIKNNFRVDKNEDTFWFKKINLTDQQYLILDSGLVEACKQKVKGKIGTSLDGIGISSMLTLRGDTNIISFLNPSKESDSLGYNFTQTLLRNIKFIFNDSLVHEYFDDIEVYIDESKWHRPNVKRQIDRMRIKKYNWTISN